MYINELNLSELKVGDRGIISSVSSEASIQNRLAELGFYIGEPVQCVLESPLGDPKAYRICGAVIALRKEDASNITINRK